MTKLIDSLCVAKEATKVRNRKPFKVVDSVLAIDQNKLNDIRSFIDDNPDASTRDVFEEAYYVVTGSDYDSDKSKYATWLEDFDVMALRRLWPNGDEYESEVVYIPDNGTDQVAIPSTLTDGPESLMIVPKELVDALGFDAFMELQPGFYYVDSISADIEDIGESLDDLKAWVRDLESFRDRDGYYKGITAKMAWEPVTKLLGSKKRKKKSDEGIKDSSEEDSKRQSALEELNKLRKSIPDSKMLEALPRVSSSEDIFDLIDRLRSYFSVDKISDSVVKFRITPNDSDAVRKLFSEANIPLKESNDWLFSAEAPKERVVELLKDYKYEIEDSTSKVSDATYNPKFEKLRKVLSDTTIVEELSHYLSSDELEEFTETLTRNYDIDLEEVEDSSK